MSDELPVPDRMPAFMRTPVPLFLTAAGIGAGVVLGVVLGVRLGQAIGRQQLPPQPKMVPITVERCAECGERAAASGVDKLGAQLAGAVDDAAVAALLERQEAVEHAGG